MTCFSGTEITLTNKAITNPAIAESARHGGSGYGLLEWPAPLRRLGRVSSGYTA